MMPPLLRLLPLVCLVALGLADRAAAQSAAQPAAEPEGLTVVLMSGRKFTGQVDARTNDSALVLRFSRGAATLWRPIAWDRIVSASVGERAIDLADLRAAAEAMKSDAARPRQIAEQPIPQDTQAAPEPVTSVSFDVRLANWDGDVENDGLLLDVFPLDANQILTPVRGTVEVELFAPQRRGFLDAPQAGGDTLELVERWSRPIRPESFGTSGARLKLPFGAVHPEMNREWLAYGLVHVRLIVPGQGVFDDSRDAVRIRPWAPNRDQLDLNTGRRFLPTEAVGRRN